MADNIDDQIKIVQRDKLFIEIDKIKAEKRKLELDIENAENEKKIKWWQKSKFWTQFGSIFLGIGIVAVYITYVIVPISDINNKTATITNINNSLENAKQRDSLNKQQNIIIEKNRLIAFEESYIASVKDRIENQKDSIIKSNESIQKLSKDDNNVKIQEISNRLNNYIQKQQDLVPNIVGKWLSSLFNLQEKWEVRNTTDRSSFDITLTTPNGNGIGTAVYNNNGKFTVVLSLKGINRLLKMKYIWTINGVPPTQINSVFTVLESNDAGTPVGTKQSDVLIKQY